MNTVTQNNQLEMKLKSLEQSERLEQAFALRKVCARYGVSLHAAALQFPLAHPAVSSVLTATRTPSQLEDNVRQFETRIPLELWADLLQGGLLEDRVPTPQEKL